MIKINWFLFNFVGLDIWCEFAENMLRLLSLIIDLNY